MDWREKAHSNQFITLIGPLLECFTGECWVYGLRVEPRHTNGAGIMHGGMMTAFLDEAIGSVVHAADDRRHVTVQLDVSFLQPVQVGDFIVCTCDLVHSTRAMSYLSAQCRVDERVVATASSIYKAIRKRTAADPHT